jgi:capsular polysaccharide biosynthesis protein
MVSEISLLMNIAIALALGIMLSVFIVFARYYWKVSAVKTEEDIPQIKD